jgi:hypothetical protein
VRLAPRLMSYLPRPNPTWPEVVNAADWPRHDLDVSKPPLWGEACIAMGRVAIDSKLRGCDVVKVKIGDLVSGG